MGEAKATRRCITRTSSKHAGRPADYYYFYYYYHYSYPLLLSFTINYHQLLWFSFSFSLSLSLSFIIIIIITIIIVLITITITSIISSTPLSSLFSWSSSSPSYDAKSLILFVSWCFAPNSEFDCWPLQNHCLQPCSSHQGDVQSMNFLLSLGDVPLSCHTLRLAAGGCAPHTVSHGKHC